MAAQRVARPDSAGPSAPTRSLCRRGHRRGQPDVALGDGRGRPLLGRHLGPRLQPPPAARESPRQPPTRPPPSPCQTQAAGPTPRPPWRAPNEGSALTRGRSLSPHPPRARARMARGKPRPERPTRDAESEAPLPASLALPRRAARAVVPTKPARTARGGGPGQHWAGGWTGVHGRSPGKLGSLRGRVLIYLLTYFSVTVDSRCYISVGGTAWWSGICRPYRATPRSVPRPPGTVPACYVVVCVPCAVLDFPATVL